MEHNFILSIRLIPMSLHSIAQDIGKYFEFSVEYMNFALLPKVLYNIELLGYEFIYYFIIALLTLGVSHMYENKKESNLEQTK